MVKNMKKSQTIFIMLTVLLSAVPALAAPVAEGTILGMGIRFRLR